MAKIIGIDLGTTFSAVAVMEVGNPKIIENAEGVRTTPSIVAVSKTGERLVGLLAKRQAVTNPKNTVFGIKRFIGHKFSDPAVQKDKTSVPYEIKEAPDGSVLVHMGDKDYRAEEISAMILQKLKADAEAKLGEKVTQAIITVPAYFDDAQRQATKNAGQIAGLEVLRIINEPTAAALAYGFNKKKNEQIAVFDFGGGTFDISILEVADVDGQQSIEVRSTDGDSHLGGKDIDQKIINWLADEFKKESGIDVRSDALALQRLDEAAEKAKIELSTATETEVNIPFITSDASGPRHLLIKMNRAKLEELAQEFIDRAMQITERAMKASPFQVGDIDEVVLVGGQTRMPALEAAVKKYFGKEPNKSINPDEVVALGAAVQGGVLAGDVKDILLLDVIPLSLGIETMGGVNTKLIEKNTTIPSSRSQVFSTAADNQTSVEIHIVQGERAMAADNKSLGRFILDGIPPAPRGMPQVEVTFDVDANGILNVTAKDKATGKAQSIRIEAGSSLSKEDIERMQKEAEAHAAEDEKKKELVDARNTAEQLIYTSEKALKDAPTVPEDIRSGVNTKIDELRKTLSTPLEAGKDSDSLDNIKSATEALSTELSKIGEFMNKQTQQGNTTEETAKNAPEGDVKDADFKETPDNNSENPPTNA